MKYKILILFLVLAAVGFGVYRYAGVLLAFLSTTIGLLALAIISIVLIVGLYFLVRWSLKS